ncbi:MAG: hypothetical protein KC589_00080 [Nanoarchaeota archaeon]|nr:hypothetical protein [Nanoarchaeota archaeon]
MTYINFKTGEEKVRIQKNYSHAFAENLNKQIDFLNKLIEKTKKHNEHNYLHNNYEELFTFFVEFSITYLQFLNSMGIDFERDRFVSYGGHETICLRFDNES